MDEDDCPLISARQFREEIAWHTRQNNRFVLIMALLGLILGIYIGRLTP